MAEAETMEPKPGFDWLEFINAADPDIVRIKGLVKALDCTLAGLQSDRSCSRREIIDAATFLAFELDHCAGRLESTIREASNESAEGGRQ
jgi:hypothetical protein